MLKGKNDYKFTLKYKPLTLDLSERRIGLPKTNGISESPPGRRRERLGFGLKLILDNYRFAFKALSVVSLVFVMEQFVNKLAF